MERCFITKFCQLYLLLSSLSFFTLFFEKSNILFLIMKQLSEFEKSSSKHHETVQKTSVALVITTLEFIQALETTKLEKEV
jgi:hypothetical protein